MEEQPDRRTDMERFAHGSRLDRRTLVQRILKSLPAMILAFLPLLVRSEGSLDRIGLLFLGVYGVIAVPLIVLHYLRFWYWITPREIIIQSGILTRRKRSIPLERIQNIEIERSLMPRLLGTAKVNIETAGSTSTEGVLEYVSVDDAQRIRQVVRTYQRAEMHGPATERPVDQAEVVEAADDGRTPLFSLSWQRMLLSGAFRFSLIYIAIIFSGLQYVLDVLGLEPNEIADWLVRGGFQPYADIVFASPWMAGTLLVLLAALLGWVTGILINLNRYYDFHLWRTEDKLQKRHGLLTVSEGTIPLGRIQALVLRSNPLMRRYGWYRFELQIMGGDVQQRGHTVVVPFAHLDEILDLSTNIRPFTLPDAFAPVSRITIRRSFIRYALVFLAGLLPLSYFFPAALWGLLALPLLLGFAVLQYRNHGYAFDGDLLFVRRGVIRQHVWVVPVEKFQVFLTEATYFQRRLGLVTVSVDTAGASTFTYPEIVDLKTEPGHDLLQTLYTRFQDYFNKTAQSSKA